MYLDGFIKYTHIIILILVPILPTIMMCVGFFYIDKEANIVYGYNYNNKNFKEKKGIKDAMAGNIYFSDIMFLSNDTFVESAFPVYNNN